MTKLKLFYTFFKLSIQEKFFFTRVVYKLVFPRFHNVM